MEKCKPTQVPKLDDRKEDLLCDVRSQALDKGDMLTLVAANQKLWELYPRTYQRMIGPLHERQPKKGHSCYCNNPQNLLTIWGDIRLEEVPSGALNCDNCWEIDLLTTWLLYKDQIPTQEWNRLCELRELHQLFPE